MILLTRTVRFSINSRPPVEPLPAFNTFAGYPAMTGLGRHYELTVCCRGEADRISGYFLNIKAIDTAVRSAGVPIIQFACDTTPDAEPATILRKVCEAVARALPRGATKSVRWSLSPYYSLEMSPDSPSTALLRQQFDFAAAHRLHVPSLSDEANRDLFGKCNNPAGHGHNYRVEPCVAVRLDTPQTFTLADLERATHVAVISRFDHTHLNEDTPEFATGTGLNPSVENMAKVFFERLAPEIAAAGKSAELRCITVWETDKTSATYPA